MEDMTHDEVEKILTSKGIPMKKFYEFIAGQTISKNGQGEIVYYGCDIDRFLKGKAVID